jgi:hypothetical protein
MKKGRLILTIAILTFTSCVTRPYTIDDPHYITTNGASWLSSLVPGLTQFINGEYLEGSIYLLGTASTGIISGLAYNGIIQNPEIDDHSNLSGLLLGYSIAAWSLSYLDGVGSTHRLNKEKEEVLLDIKWLADKPPETKKQTDEQIRNARKQEEMEVREAKERAEREALAAAEREARNVRIAEHNKKNTGIWQIRYFVDKFGDPTEEPYITTTIEGTFSNSATRNSELTAVIFVSEKDEFAFELYEYIWGSLVTPSKYNQYALEVKEESGSQYKVLVNTDWRYRFHIKDISIIDTLRKGGTTRFYFEKTGSANSYRFDIVDTNRAFAEAYTALFGN